MSFKMSVEEKRRIVRDHFKLPESHLELLVLEVLEGYESDLADATKAKEQAVEGQMSALSWQRHQLEVHKKESAEAYRRNQEERATLVRELGFAARVYDRIRDARWRGKKTVRIDDVLEGQPSQEEAA